MLVLRCRRLRLPAASSGPREVEATTKVKSKDYAWTQRRKATSVEIARIRQKLGLGEEKVYIGRITGSKGSSSVWANPFKIGVHGSRAGGNLRSTAST